MRGVGAGVDREEQAGGLDLVVELLARHAGLHRHGQVFGVDASAPAFMRLTSRLMPPCTASRWPSSDEPTPNGMTGTLYCAASFTASPTSCVLWANTTAAGGGHVKGRLVAPVLLAHHQGGGEAIAKAGLERVHQGLGHLAGLDLGQQVGDVTGAFMGCLQKWGRGRAAGRGYSAATIAVRSKDTAMGQPPHTNRHPHRRQRHHRPG